MMQVKAQKGEIIDAASLKQKLHRMKIAQQHQLNVQIDQHKKYSRQMAGLISSAQVYTKKKPSAPFTELLLDPKKGGLPGALGSQEACDANVEVPLQHALRGVLWTIA